MDGKGLYRDHIKRILDIVLSAVALVILSPLLLITAILVWIKLGSPVVFRQPRPGKGEKIFYLFKFRSMTNEIGEDGKLLPDSERLTKFGKFLRASSLDELLELVNIIRGDMSIVGPRPLSIFYLPHYPSDVRRRHDVRPGLTGLAQINGRNNLQWDERLLRDIEYVDKISLRLDIKIICNTVFKVLDHSDITVRGENHVKDYGSYCVLKEEGARGEKKRNMKYSEIGSYFWLEGNEGVIDFDPHRKVSWLPMIEDDCFTFSGRNAINIALRDIMVNYKINVVYVPSYCCVSMLQEFIDIGLKIKFYSVSFENGGFTYQMPQCGEHAVVLIMSYFGLDARAAHKVIEGIHKTGAIIIEDITHSLLRKDALSEDSDYAVASLRKWFPVPTGGWVGKKAGRLSERSTMDSNHAVEEKISAMREKYSYLTGGLVSKENFLLAQAKFENDLIHVDRLLKIDDTSFNIVVNIEIDKVISQRRKNAKVLVDGLADLGAIISIPKVDLSEDVPLFLPVIMKTTDRDSLKKYLIDHGIYCPVHWPEIMGAPLGIQENELSLICDQRYDEGDMQAIVDEINEWYQRKE